LPGDEQFSGIAPVWLRWEIGQPPQGRADIATCSQAEHWSRVLNWAAKAEPGQRRSDDQRQPFRLEIGAGCIESQGQNTVELTEIMRHCFYPAPVSAICDEVD
jgi:hypothetical protein